MARVKKAMPVSLSKRRPRILALLASAALTVLVVIGSRNLEHYDSALFGYTVASIVAFGAIVYRYAIWLGRPATRVYWRRGWQLYRQRDKLLANTASAAKTITTNLVAQRFIFKRGISRWLMHQLIMWGCIISALITFPLVFGWVHFKLEGARGYRPFVFGFPMAVMDGREILAWLTFHALDFTAPPPYFPKETGTVTGLVGAFGGLGGFFPPLVLGFIRDATGGYAWGFVFLAFFALICLAVNYFVFLRRDKTPGVASAAFI